MSADKQNHLNTCLNLIRDWLLNSGIQNVDGRQDIIGGFNSWYDPEKKLYPYIYSEITGYGITTLLYFYSISGEKLFLDRAELAANWLINSALHHHGAVSTRFYYPHVSTADPYSSQEETLVAFDNGMVIFGVCKLYQITGKKKYLHFAQKIGEFLLDLQRPNYSIYAIYNYKTKEKVDTPVKWSTQTGAFHAKVAMGLWELYQICKRRRFLEASKMLCEHSLLFQTESGRFITFRDTGFSHAHPHCYTAEGLLFIGYKTGNNLFIKAAYEATKWLMAQQENNGGISSIYFNKSEHNHYQRSDAIAQITRLVNILTGLRFRFPQLDSRNSKFVKRILEFQKIDPDKIRIHGGLRFGQDEDGNSYPHINSWCSMFAFQALASYLNRHDKNAVHKVLDFLV